jgi:hypothetical protein
MCSYPASWIPSFVTRTLGYSFSSVYCISFIIVYSSMFVHRPNIVRMITLRNMKWAVHTAGEMRNVYCIFVDSTGGKRVLRVT